MSKAAWLIYFDDYDRRPEIITDEAAARERFRRISDAWNAHLFVKVQSNTRDDPLYTANAPDMASELDRLQRRVAELENERDAAVERSEFLIAMTREAQMHAANAQERLAALSEKP